MLTVQQVVFAVFALCLTSGAMAQDERQFIQQEPMNEVCLGCVCEAISGCNRTLDCSGDVCGLFRITWAYWSDAGKPVLQNDSPDSQGAYGRCTVDPYCAATTVQNYMAKFAKDCNGDRVINCFDYARIHRLGGYGCEAPLDALYENRFNACMRHVQQLGG